MQMHKTFGLKYLRKMQYSYFTNEFLTIVISYLLELKILTSTFNLTILCCSSIKCFADKLSRAVFSRGNCSVSLLVVEAYKMRAVVYPRAWHQTSNKNDPCIPPLSKHISTLFVITRDPTVHLISSSAKSYRMLGNKDNAAPDKMGSNIIIRKLSQCNILNSSVNFRFDYLPQIIHLLSESNSFLHLARDCVEAETTGIAQSHQPNLKFMESFYKLYIISCIHALEHNLLPNSIHFPIENKKLFIISPVYQGIGTSISIDKVDKCEFKKCDFIQQIFGLRFCGRRFCSYLCVYIFSSVYDVDIFEGGRSQRYAEETNDDLMIVDF
ncbi:hypothetical protein EGR_04279 [Echinococcus granulosus]|uniref:Uncharacterized protein n=1 Tax=Echinococcus granulosus TaxID=6210 RepID=W6UH01_ECHGR|nr:hypothetical protein EGR_04279 [Echinococcus granulosus]EUB60840.1 hypothetical protein EGR_04279 [Echinococcus granulosus]